MGTKAALRFIGKNVAVGIARAPGSAIVGRVLNLIFGGSNDAAIMELGEKLDVVQQSINQLSKMLDDSTAEILRELEEIQEQQRYQAWSNKNAEVTKQITRINVQYSRLVEFSQSPGTTAPALVEALISEILSTIGGAEVALNQLHRQVLNFGLDTGALELFADMVFPTIEARERLYEDALDNFIAYYSEILYAQAQAIYVLIEAYNALEAHPEIAPQAKGSAEKVYEKYLQMVKAQEVTFITLVHRIMSRYRVDFEIQKQLEPGPSSFPNLFVSSTSSGNRGLQAQKHFLDGWYTPDPHLLEAEEICASALGQGSGRIVVYMCYPSLRSPTIPQFPSNFAGVDIDLSLASNPLGDSFEATRKDFLIIEDKASEPRANLTIKRFVFDELPYDTYLMRDKIGTEGLIPISGSFGTVHFQSDRSLRHVMALNPEFQFDLLTFTPYWTGPGEFFEPWFPGGLQVPWR